MVAIGEGGFYTPKELAGLELFLRTDSGQLFTDIAGTIPATVNITDDIQHWKDQSPNGYDFDATGAGTPPRFRQPDGVAVPGTNYYAPTTEFPSGATDSHLTVVSGSSALDFEGTQPLTLFMVMQAGAGDSPIYHKYDDTAKNGWRLYRFGTRLEMRVAYNAAANNETGWRVEPMDATWHAIVIRYDGGGLVGAGSWDVAIDGVAQVFTSTLGVGLSTGSALNSTSARLHSHNDGITPQNETGLNEFGIVSRRLADAEVTRYFAYTKQRYGLG